ncbi:pilus assembly PilX family protein [Cellulomonas sp. P5_E12]
MLVLAMLAMTALAFSLSGSKFARFDQDYTGSMAAAQAGVEDFISRMNREDVYGYKPDCNNPAWKGPMLATSNDCSWTPSTTAGWQVVEAGQTGPKAAAFHYVVDSSKQGVGIYQLYVTGRVNGRYRTVDVTVGKGGSTDYVYYTDFESADPANVQAYDPSGATKVVCGKDGSEKASYWHSSAATDGKPKRDGQNCVEIQFVGGDELDGEVMTNDTILANLRASKKALFKKQVWTADPKCKTATADSTTWEDACLRDGSVANFNDVQPKYHDPLYLEDSSAGFATVPGCHYFGSTRIKFTADGKMTVWNKTSVNGGQGPLAIPVLGGVAPDCGDVVSLNKDEGATVPVPNEKVIYVAASTDPATQRQCHAQELGGGTSSSDRLPLGSYTGAAPGSASSTYNADANMLEVTKYCGQGNLYAEGVLKGRVTLAAAQSIIATGDLVLAGGTGSGSPDILGLVATNAVEVFHPRVGQVKSIGVCTKTNPDGSCKTRSTSTFEWTNEVVNDGDYSGWPHRYKEPGASGYTPADGLQIAGSIQTLQHSFLVQKYNVGGDAGTLLVVGSIAQRWRGIVGQTVSGNFNGYLKLYKYDPRLQYSTPPYFPKWANAKYTLRYSGEVVTPAGLKT